MFFRAICILESFKSKISVAVCSFFQFGTVSKWCIREWVKLKHIYFTSIGRQVLTTYTNFSRFCSCNLIASRPGSGNSLREGVLLSTSLCRSGICTKLGINMGLSGEPRCVQVVEGGTCRTSFFVFFSRKCITC